MTCSAGASLFPDKASVSLNDPCTSNNETSSGTFSDGPGVYQNSWECSWTIRSNSPVVVSFSLFELESIYDVVYIQSCTLQGVCDEIPRISWGTGVLTQEIALLTGPKMANPTKIPSRMLVSTTTVRNRLCGPNVNPQCLVAYGGYNGPSILPPYDLFTGQGEFSTINFFDGNTDTFFEGPNKGYSNWIRVDFSKTVNISSIVLRNHPWGQTHENYESIYATTIPGGRHTRIMKASMQRT